MVNQYLKTKAPFQSRADLATFLHNRSPKTVPCDTVPPAGEVFV